MSNRVDREHWEKRLKNAKQRLDFARAFLKEVKTDMEAGTIAEDQGRDTYSRALRAEEAALREYARVVEMLGGLPSGSPRDQSTDPKSDGDGG